MHDLGFVQVIIPQYLALMRELGFNSTTPLYVASALLTYDDATGWLDCALTPTLPHCTASHICPPHTRQSLFAFLPEFDRMAALLHEEGLCSRALAKERLLPAADLAGMCSAHCAMPVGAPVKQG